MHKISNMSNKKQLQQQLNRYYSTDLPCKELNKIIGISKNDFKIWIEDHFVGGMDNENYGKIWQLDHIVPGHFFNFDNQEDINICFNYMNIIPMLNNDNRLKSGSTHFSLKVIEKRLIKNPNNISLLLLKEICENDIKNRWDKYL